LWPYDHYDHAQVAGTSRPLFLSVYLVAITGSDRPLDGAVTFQSVKRFPWHYLRLCRISSCTFRSDVSFALPRWCASHGPNSKRTFYEAFHARPQPVEPRTNVGRCSGALSILTFPINFCHQFTSITNARATRVVATPLNSTLTPTCPRATV
jgi:hypothetical protein